MEISWKASSWSAVTSSRPHATDLATVPSVPRSKLQGNWRSCAGRGLAPIRVHGKSRASRTVRRKCDLDPIRSVATWCNMSNRRPVGLYCCRVSG